MTTLTFNKEELLDTALVNPEGSVFYTTNTTQGLLDRKATTIMAASGLLGEVNWREETFTINGLQMPWNDLKSGGLLTGYGKHWQWGNTSYKLEHDRMEKELSATSSFGTAVFTIYEPHLIEKNKHATMYFPHEMHDEVERMFVLMVVLQMEMHRQDMLEAAAHLAFG